MSLNRGTLCHTVLVYAVSEPGEWTPGDIAEDLVDASPMGIVAAVNELVDGGLLHQNSTDGRLYPSRAGKEAVKQAS